MQRRLKRRRRQKLQRRFILIVPVLLVVLLVLPIGLRQRKAGEASPVATVAVVQTPEPTVAPAATQIPEPAASPEVLQAIAPAQEPGEWATPCVSEYDYQYVDDMRSIYIDRVEQDGVVWYAVDVQIRNADQFQTLLSGGGYGAHDDLLSSMASSCGAVLAINGDYYGAHEYGVIIRNGVLYRTEKTTRNMLIVDQNGDFTVRAERSDEDPKQLGEQLVSEGVRQTFEFGPELIRNGEPVEFNPDFDVISTRSNRLEPRTAIGQIGPLHYVIIVADGRQDASRGLSLQELQQLFVYYGAQTAMNLDGGGSSGLWFQGQLINSPSGGEERAISDIIWF